MSNDDHHRVSPQGQAMGKSAARMADLGLARLASLGLHKAQAPMLRTEMCKSCACMPGSVPNGCLQTQLDFLKSVHEGTPFRCHAPMDGKMCAGWVRARAEVVANPLPSDVVALLDKWEYTPPDAAEVPEAMREDLHAAIMNLPCKSENMEAEPNQRLAYKIGHRDARHAAAEIVQSTRLRGGVSEGFVIAPHFRGYAHLGIGAYVINHSRAGELPELVISVANEEDKADRQVGDDRDNPEGSLIQPEQMAVRIAFENVAGLDALEKQLRYLREVHFTDAPQAPAPEQDVAAASLAAIHCRLVHGGPIDSHTISVIVAECERAVPGLAAMSAQAGGA